jgi:hypothetical protein
VYGTNVSTSDLDFKGIFIPSGKEVLLQTATKTSVNFNTNPTSKKNTPEDIDQEFFSILGFIRLCSEGQTAAYDILFTPPIFWKDFGSDWSFIIENRSKLIHKGTTAFSGYCQTQAAKYGIKGSRIASVRTTLDFLKGLPSAEPKLIEYWDLVTKFVADHQSDKFSSVSKEGKREPFITFTRINNPKGVPEDYLEVNTRCFGQNMRVKEVIKILEKIFQNYGDRARLAELNEGIDWKALMHAVRVCREAVELLQTGIISFPRPERDLLLQIRKGELPYKEVAERIEEGLQILDEENIKSTLPLSIERDFWEDWVLHKHFEAAKEWVDQGKTIKL